MAITNITLIVRRSLIGSYSFDTSDPENVYDLLGHDGLAVADKIVWMLSHNERLRREKEAEAATAAAFVTITTDGRQIYNVGVHIDTSQQPSLEAICHALADRLPIAC